MDGNISTHMCIRYDDAFGIGPDERSFIEEFAVSGSG